MMDETEDLYRCLGVTPQATSEDITQAYRSLARRWHPDKQQPQYPHENSGEKWNDDNHESTTKFQQIGHAYGVLKSEELRKQYDRQRELTWNHTMYHSAELRKEDLEYVEEAAVYTALCRCGGEYEVAEEDLIKPQSQSNDEEEEQQQTETETEIVVPCSSCSLRALIRISPSS